MSNELFPVGKHPKPITLNSENNPTIDVNLLHVLKLINKRISSLFPQIKYSHIRITEVGTSFSLGELRKRERASTPIKEICPFYEDLIALGINPESIESHYRNVSKERPIMIDPNRPDRLELEKGYGEKDRIVDAFLFMAKIVPYLMLNTAPEPRLAPMKLIPLCRKVLERDANNNLQSIIDNSNSQNSKERKTTIDYDDPRLKKIRSKITEDIKSNVVIMFLGAKVLGVRNGQTPYNCSYSALEELHEAIAVVLSQETISNLLTYIANEAPGTVSSADKIRQQLSQIKEEYEQIVTDALGIDPNNANIIPGENWRRRELLADLFLKSQIPLVAMADSF